MLRKGRFDVTARLESLEEAEVRARQAVEDARKEAHRIRLGIGSQIEELASRKTRNLSRSRETAKEKVQEAVSRLESDLCDQVSIRLAELGNRETDLNEKAVELISGVIMSAEEEGT
jgi:hypothetical protein